MASVAQAPPSTDSTTADAKAKGMRALRVLRRSYSTKHASVSSPNLASPPAAPAVDAQKDDALPASPKRSKAGAFDWLTLGKLGAKKGAKKSGDGASVPEPPQGATSSSSPKVATESGLPVVPEESPEVRAADTTPGVLPLAQRIQSLLSSVPPFLTTMSPTPDSSGGKQNSGTSTTPADPSAITSARLLSMLATPSCMNGCQSKGQLSVWSTLDNLRVLSLKSRLGKGGSGKGGSTGMVDDTDCIMFYGPLVPEDASTVKLGRSQVVSVDDNGKVLKVVSDSAVPPPLPAGGEEKAEGWSWRWPFYHADTPASSGATITKRVWVPSTTELSLQVTWWGYRLFVSVFGRVRRCER